MRQAFSILELMVSLSLICLLMAVLFPAIQEARETARRIDCANRLRQIGIASAARETSHGDLPYGFLNAHPLSSEYSKDFGHLARILAYADWHGELNDQSNIFALENSRSLSSRVRFLECPSSILPRKSGPYAQDFLGLKPLVNGELAQSDYNFSAGYLDKPTGFGTATFHEGAGALSIQVDRGVRLAEILDGTSNTLLVWESVSGAIVQRDSDVTKITQVSPGNSQTIFVTRDNRFVELSTPETFRAYAHSWAGFREGYLSIDNKRLINIDNYLGRPFSFHRSGVNVAFCDGAVRFVSSSTDSVALCSMVSINRSESTVLRDE